MRSSILGYTNNFLKNLKDTHLTRCLKLSDCQSNFANSNAHVIILFILSTNALILL